MAVSRPRRLFRGAAAGAGAGSADQTGGTPPSAYGCCAYPAGGAAAYGTSVGTAATGDTATAVPQFSQNRAPSGSFAPQLGQNFMTELLWLRRSAAYGTDVGKEPAAP